MSDLPNERFLPDDPNDLEPLTPSHILLMKGKLLMARKNELKAKPGGCISVYYKFSELLNMYDL